MTITSTTHTRCMLNHELVDAYRSLDSELKTMEEHLIEGAEMARYQDLNRQQRLVQRELGIRGVVT